MANLATDLARVVEVLNHVDNLAWRRKWSYDDIGRIREARAIISTLYTRAASGGDSGADGSITLSQEGQAILAQCIAGHGAVVGYLTAGRPDLAMGEAMKWTQGFLEAARIVRESDT